MFETVAVTVAVSAVVFLPLGALYGHSVAAHVSAEASAVKAHVTATLAAVKSDAQVGLADVAKKL
jgi:hypothetical protein